LGNGPRLPNETHFPRELIEEALAHTIADKTEKAYQRGQALRKRRPLMAAWARYCDSPAISPATGDVVVALRQ